MQRYKALEDLGVKPEDCYTNWMADGEKEDRRYNDWLKEKEEYGIDERYTWNWSDDFMDYMYIHLEMFNRVNIVAFDREYIEFEGQTLIFSLAHGGAKRLEGQQYKDVLNTADRLMYTNKEMLKTKYGMAKR